MVAKVISVFNNKGGVGKTTICWNVADSLARQGKRVLLLDSDPQCNLSIAMLGDDAFQNIIASHGGVAGRTIRNFMQNFLQNTGKGITYIHKGPHTHELVDLVAGDFWLNIYADALNVGSDLLSGTGLARYVALRKLIENAEAVAGVCYDYVIIDLPPSFGTLVRAAFYSSDYYIVPCTSDNFCVYCVGLIGQMIPDFISDWQTGLSRFKGANPTNIDYDHLGAPVFAGWVFNGFDTRMGAMIRADNTMHKKIAGAVSTDLVGSLNSKIVKYKAVSSSFLKGYQVGDIEDANNLIQNSIWLSVPLGQLHHYRQVVDLRNRAQWAPNQLEKIDLLRHKFHDLASEVIRLCV